MSVKRPGGRDGNFAAIAKSMNNGVNATQYSHKRHMGVRRPATRNIRDERYQLGAYGTVIRSSGATAAYQRP